ncbi:hypothetical protein HQ38_03470 [Porphyromonas crevioricanis]|uniref:Uncharacterized protein n=1 Tax=Porphyromonas crevioricanis TaxID=393921 RepID=A0AB34PHG7_9PORP|nr:hypothetical protein HQ38_03470 [Porphyromonas crevioricanis]
MQGAKMEAEEIMPEYATQSRMSQVTQQFAYSNAPPSSIAILHLEYFLAIYDVHTGRQLLKWDIDLHALDAVYATIRLVRTDALNADCVRLDDNLRCDNIAGSIADCMLRGIPYSSGRLVDLILPEASQTACLEVFHTAPAGLSILQPSSVSDDKPQIEPSVPSAVTVAFLITSLALLD